MDAVEAMVLFDLLCEDSKVLTGLSSAQTAALWGRLSTEQSDVLWRLFPAVVGNKSGVPLIVRMEANRLTALERLQSHQLPVPEREYLSLVSAGAVQLVTYDPENSRIVESFNVASWGGAQGVPRFIPREDTPDVVITYVPGIRSALAIFYSCDIYQDLASSLVGDSAGVAFVYKDGWFPGEQNLDDMPGSFIQAGDERVALAAGRVLSCFHDDVMRDPVLSESRQVAMGHSWGLAAIAASEIVGAKYDLVVSLAGAYLPTGWYPNPTTEYSHHSYYDVLKLAHWLDSKIPVWLTNVLFPNQIRPGGKFVGSGNFPGENPAFMSRWYRPARPHRLFGNHDLIFAGRNPANSTAVSNIRGDVYKTLRVRVAQ